MHGRQGDHGKTGKNLQFDVAYYSAITASGKRNYLVLYEYTTNALYAFLADKRIIFIADGGKGEDGADGESGKEGGDGRITIVKKDDFTGMFEVKGCAAFERVLLRPNS